MNSWLKTGKGMVSQLMDVVAPQPMPISKRKKNNNYNNNNIGERVLFTTLNQDNSYVCCGTTKGFQIFRSKPFEKIFESNDIIPLKIAMLFDKSLIGVISKQNNISIKDNEMNEINELKQNWNTYKFQLYDIKNGEEIWSIESIDRSLNNIRFSMNKTRLVISMENNSLSIFDITNKMKALYPIIMTYDNNGIFDLCQDSENCLLGYPDQSGKGRIGIIDAFNLQKRFVIEAHDSSLQIIKFNENGNYIASASSHGTLIRIFSLKKYQNKAIQIATFRRGTFNSKIQCLAFNPSSTFLCCSSINSDTIHIFNLHQAINGNNNNNLDDIQQTVLPTLNVVTDYLPISVKNTIEHPRSCVDIQIKSNQIIKKNINDDKENDDDADNHNNNNNKCPFTMQCGFINDKCIVIATQNGYFYRYSINVNAKETIDRTKLLSEHSLKRNDIDLHHQQTKIYGIDNIDSSKPALLNNNNNNDINTMDNNNNINDIKHAVNNLNIDEQHHDIPYIQQYEPGSTEMNEQQQEERKEDIYNGDNNINNNNNNNNNENNESPESQSPEIFNTNYQNTINENDNFKLDLQPNYT